MSHKLRIHFNGALYYVYLYGKDGNSILKEEEQKQQFISILKKYKIRYSFFLYAYNILDNRIELLIEVGDTPLSKIMQGIIQTYTRNYNLHNKHQGSIFNGRYKCVLCDKSNFILSIVKYIHCSGINVGCMEQEPYKWSSHNDYTLNDSGFVDVSPVLDILSVDRATAIKLYKDFIFNTEGSNMVKISDFRLKSLKMIKRQYKVCEDKIYKKSLSKLIEQVLTQENMTLEEIKGSRKRKSADIKKAIVLLGKKYTNASNRQIAKSIRIDESMVSKILAGEYKKTDYLVQIITKFQQKEYIYGYKKNI